MPLTPLSTPPLTALASALSDPHGFGDQSLVRANPDAIRLLGGIPDPSVLPVDELSEAFARIWSSRSDAVAALQYSSATGFDGLRSWIAQREGVDVSRIVITNGGMHGLSLAVTALVERGSTVAVENPLFPLFLRVLELSDARALPVPVQADGLDVDYLARQLESGATISAVYVVPDFHNPTQVTLSREKRRALVDLAERWNFVVLADNPYRELRYGGVDQGHDLFDESDHVIHINTFTKTLGPGLRVGWLVLPPHLVSPFVKLRNRQDSHTSTLGQTLVESLVTSDAGWFDAKLADARALYGRRARLIVDTLNTLLPGQFDAVVPEGGLFLWPRLLDDAVDATALHARAQDHGIEYQQGKYFAAGPGTDSERRLRFAFGDRADDEIVTAVERLAAAFDA